MKPKPGDSHSHSYAYGVGYFRASEGGKQKWEKLFKVLISYVHSWAATRKLYIPTFPN